MLQALAWELQAAKSYLEGQPIHTIYLGGGTPSLLSIDELQRLLAVIEQHYPLDQLQEVTLEANPDDLSPQYIKGLRATLVDRLSIGVQSFRDEDLLYMNRAHTAQQADYAIKAAQDSGYERLTIDLIYGTPGLSNMAWLQNIAQVQTLVIPHFSAYALTVEEGTALHHNIVHKKQTAVDAEQSAQQMELLMDYAPSMGFEQYELSNFASREQYALHNTNYWRGVPYLGVGPSAHSYNGRHRRGNVANNSLYISSILQHQQLPYEDELLTDKQRLNEYLMTSLRTTWGCQLTKVSEGWGSDAVKHIHNTIAPFVNKGWLLLQDDILKMSNAGKLFADYIASELFMIED